MIIGVSTLSYFNEPLEKVIPHIKGLGFNCLEVMCEPPYAHASNFDRGRRENIRKIALENGVDLVLHAPIADVNFMSLNPGIRKEAQRQIIDTIYLAQGWNSSRLVFHIGGKPYMGLWNARDAFKYSLDALEPVIAKSEEVGVRLLLENDPNKTGLGCIKWKDVQAYMEAFNGRLGFLLDVAHSFMLSDEEFDEFFTEPKDLLEGVHISSNDRKVDQHLGLDRGHLDVNYVIAKLKEANFNEEIVIEVMSANDVLPSKLIIENYITNYKKRSEEQ